MSNTDLSFCLQIRSINGRQTITMIYLDRIKLTWGPGVISSNTGLTLSIFFFLNQPCCRYPRSSTEKITGRNCFAVLIILVLIGVVWGEGLTTAFNLLLCLSILNTSYIEKKACCLKNGWNIYIIKSAHGERKVNKKVIAELLYIHKTKYQLFVNRLPWLLQTSESVDDTTH